jgi:antitoxin Phd
MYMTIEPETILSITEANQNFSRAARIAEKHGQVIIFRNNKPKYRLVDLEQEPEFELSDSEKIDVAAARILRLYRPAFEELAK